MKGIHHMSAEPEATMLVEESEESPSAHVSVLIPVMGRPEPLDDLYRELAPPVRSASGDFEFVFVVEPQFDGMTRALDPLVADGEPIRTVRVGQPLGETALLRTGLPYCRGSIVLTVPSRRRVEADALGTLVRAVEDGADLALAKRWPRRDSRINRLNGRLFHALVTWVVGEKGEELSDLTSGVRAMRRDLLETIPLYGDFARFLPVLAVREGYSVQEVATPQRATDRRKVPLSPFTYLRLLFDLLALFFLLRFTERPLRFFGLIGALAAVPGASILALLFAQRLAGQGLADRPLLLLGVLLVVLGVQTIALGLIGEIIVHVHAKDRRPYRLSDRP